MDISTMTVIELKKIAKKKGISGVSKLKKADLIKTIKKKGRVQDKESRLQRLEKQNNQAVVTKIDSTKHLNKGDQINYLKEKVNDPKWNLHKKEIEEAIKDLENIFLNTLKKEKEDFISNGGKEIDFYFESKEKEEFNKITYEYRKTKRLYFKEKENQKKINSDLKRGIIEQIKELIGSDESINVIYKKFKSLQEKWHISGPALRSDSNDLWETYKHHIERFYDFLHINRELRNIDYKHNYAEKIKIIEKAEDLVQREDIIKAGRDLNILHLLWKNELGPVAPKNRELLWKRFQEASKIIHSRRQNFQKNIEQNQNLNLERKNIIIVKIKKLTNPEPLTHNEWQLSIKKFNDLIDEFKSLGTVPKSESKENWNLFRETGRAYNLCKNQFYKNQKNNQKETIENYKSLLKEVKNINEKEDWRKFIERMKSIQIDFNKLDFVPRNILKKFRSEFQKETNLYFKRLKSGNQKLNTDEQILYKKKINLINGINKLEFTDNNIDEIYKNQWESIEKFGVLNSELETKVVNLFVKSISSLIKVNSDIKFNKANFLFEVELNCLKNNSEELQIKIDYYKRTIEGLQSEINQLENNLEFFSRSSTESPVLRDVTRKLNVLTTKLFSLKERINKLNLLKKKIINSSKKNKTNTDINEKN